MYKLSDEAEVAAIVVKFLDDVDVKLLDGKFVGLKIEIDPVDPVEPSDSVIPDDLIDQNIIDNELAFINEEIGKTDFKFRRGDDKSTEEELDAWRINAEKNLKISLPNLNRFFVIFLPEGTLCGDIKDTLNIFDDKKTIEIFYASRPPIQPPSHLTSPDLTSDQDYVYGGENGINATSVQHIAGSKGETVKVVDVEYEWLTTHEDMPTLFYDSGDYFYGYDDGHGAAIAGILAAKDNNYGVTGIAPAISLGVRSSHYAGIFEPWNAVKDAAIKAEAGGIVLVELQTGDPNGNAVPMEFDPFVSAQTIIATGNNVIVVATAGNGSVSLDGYSDTGSIMVASSKSTERSRYTTSNYGSRIDVHGWGQNITTMGWNGNESTGGHGSREQDYTNSFGGTSGAGAIVAGAAAIIQGVVKANGLSPLTPSEMRTLLIGTGTPQITPVTQKIGPLPNVVNALQSLGLYEPIVIPLYERTLFDYPPPPP